MTGSRVPGRQTATRLFNRIGDEAASSEMAFWQAAGGRKLDTNDRRTERQSLGAEAASPLAQGAGRRMSLALRTHGAHSSRRRKILLRCENIVRKRLRADIVMGTGDGASPRLLHPRTPALYSQCRHYVPARMRTTSHPMAVFSECLAVRHRHLRNARQRLLPPTVRVVRMGGRDIGGTMRKRTCTVACDDAASVDLDCPARPQPARQDIGGLFIWAAAHWVTARLRAQNRTYPDAAETRGFK